MKHGNLSIGLVVTFLLVASGADAAEVVVHDFDDGGTHGWTVVGAEPPGVELASPGPSGQGSDLYLTFEDVPNADPNQSLRLFAGPEIVGGLRGVAETCGALELDFRVIEDGGNQVTFHLRLEIDPDGNGQGAPPTVVADFRRHQTVDEADGWVHVVVPLALLDDGELPANADGAWEMGAGSSPGQWNDLLANADFAWLPLDLDGVSERYGVDNVRLITGGCSQVGACSEIQVLPFHLADAVGGTGINTLFALRNLTGREVVADVDYFTLSGEKQLETEHPLGPRETVTIGIRDVPLAIDPDGFRRGFVRIVAPGNSDGSPVLAGDFFQVDTQNNFATGNQLLREVCSEVSVRFLDFGLGSRLLVYLAQPRGGDPNADPPSFTVLVYDEAGNPLGPPTPFWSDDHALELSSSDLAGVAFGSLRFDFGASLGGAVYAEYSAEGRFSVGAAGQCEDVPSCAPDCCPPGAPRATVSGLHYTDASTCAPAVSDALNSLDSGHYRNACQAEFGGALPDEVLGARVVSCEIAPPGFPVGAVVAVEVCCPQP